MNEFLPVTGLPAPWMEHLPVGLAVFAGGASLASANLRFFALLGLPDAAAAELTLARVSEHIQRSGGPDLAQGGKLLWHRADAAIEVISTTLPDGGRMLTLVDVSDLARAEREARQASQAKSHLLATTGKGLRTPLNAIIGFSEAVLREAENPSPARVAEFARQIVESGRGLLRSINVILDVAKIESGSFELLAEPVDVARLIRTAMRQADAAAQAAETALVADLPRSLPKPRGDERRLMQVLSHLLSNAVKFTAAGGTITLGARREAGGTLLIYVRDTGVGIAAEQLEHVFEPFAQRDAARGEQGIGLGLYMSRALVTAHGGQLSLQSRPGAGTTAEIRLPL